MTLAYFCLAVRVGAAQLALLGCMSLAAGAAAHATIGDARASLQAYAAELTRVLASQGRSGSFDGDLRFSESFAHGEGQGVDHASPVLVQIGPHAQVE